MVAMVRGGLFIQRVSPRGTRANGELLLRWYWQIKRNYEPPAHKTKQGVIVFLSAISISAANVVI